MSFNTPFVAEPDEASPFGAFIIRDADDNYVADLLNPYDDADLALDFEPAIARRAAFIVRAVNAHDEMVEALKAAKVVIAMMERPLGMGGEVNSALDARCAKIDAALSRHGEGKP
jgi:hypothetical protein